MYRGLQRLLERDVKAAAALLIDCIATFSCNEICSYQNFIVYAVMSNLLNLPRPQLKEKILDGPEILSVATDIPEVVSNWHTLCLIGSPHLIFCTHGSLTHLPQNNTHPFILPGLHLSLQQPTSPIPYQHIPYQHIHTHIQLKLVQALYNCDYNTYLQAMVEVEPILHADRYFQPHLSYWMRELHILAYKQFLDSYQSVTLLAMATSFGVSVEFIDYHASRFIAAGRLSAKIDKYGGVVLTNRPDLKNAQYRETIHKGDLLLNRIQKLARVVDL